jgi:hypothetical protein
VWMRPFEHYSDEAFTSEEYRKGIVYYLAADERVSGVLLWNMPDKDSQKEDRAIHIIKSRRHFSGDSPISAIAVSDHDYLD